MRFTTSPKTAVANDISSERIICFGVGCDGVRVVAVESGVITMAVAYQHIQRISAREGLLSAHPIMQMIFGAVAVVIGGYAVLQLLLWFSFGLEVFVKGEEWLISLLLLGAWLIATAFRSGYFLDVQSSMGRKRFIFEKGMSAGGLEEFIKLLESESGLKVEREFVRGRT